MNPFPKDKYKVKVQHYYKHHWIDPDTKEKYEFWATRHKNAITEVGMIHGFNLREIDNYRYITAASVYERDPNSKTHSKIPLLTVFARCNKADVPSRKLGYKVASERLIAAAKGMGII